MAPLSFRAVVRAGMVPSFHRASEREPRNLPQNAALRQSVSHGVSFRRLPSYTLSRCAGLPLKGKQDVTGLPSCFLSTLNILLNWPPWAAPPYPALTDFLHGKACHTILRSLCSLTARLSPTHNILRVTAFLQNMFAGVTRVPLPPHPGNRINRSTFLHRVMWHNSKRP